MGPNTNKRDGKNHQQMHRLEQAFKHGKTSAARGWQQAQQYRKRYTYVNLPALRPEASYLRDRERTDLLNTFIGR